MKLTDLHCHILPGMDDGTTRSLLLCRISCGFAKKWAKISANFLQKAIDFCDLKLYTLKHKIILEKGSTDDEKACNEHGKIL